MQLSYQAPSCKLPAVPGRLPLFRGLPRSLELIVNSFVYYHPDDLSLPSATATHWRYGRSGRCLNLDP